MSDDHATLSDALTAARDAIAEASEYVAFSDSLAADAVEKRRTLLAETVTTVRAAHLAVRFAVVAAGDLLRAASAEPLEGAAECHHQAVLDPDVRTITGPTIGPGPGPCSQ